MSRRIHSRDRISSSPACCPLVVELVPDSVSGHQGTPLSTQAAEHGYSTTRICGCADFALAGHLRTDQRCITERNLLAED